MANSRFLPSGRATAFLDRSKRDGTSLSLTAVAALEDVWLEFNQQRRDLITERGGLESLDMKALMPRVGSFGGDIQNPERWTISWASDLLSIFTHESKIYLVTCTIDLEAYQAWVASIQMYSPEFACARSVILQLLRWYSCLPISIATKLDLNIDRNEPYRKHIDRLKTENPLHSGLLALTFLGEINSVNGKDHPGIQAADMIAWCHASLAAGKVKESELAVKRMETLNDDHALFSKWIVESQKSTTAALANRWRTTMVDPVLAE